MRRMDPMARVRAAAAALLTVALPAAAQGEAALQTHGIGTRIWYGAARLDPAAGGAPWHGTTGWMPLPAGAAQLRFGPVRQDGVEARPAALDLDLAAGDRVRVVVGAAMPPQRQPGDRAVASGHGTLEGLVPAQDQSRWSQSERGFELAPGSSGVRLEAASGAMREVFVETRLRLGTGSAGVFVRAGTEGRYALRIDAATHVATLERHLGSSVLVLARQQLVPTDGFREVSLQAHGFRIEAHVDDAVVARVMDGAFTDGTCGIEADAACQATFGPFFARAPLPQAPVVAVVQRGTEATLVARLPDAVGSPVALGLWLDRPGPVLPLGEAGLEPWLLLPAARGFLAASDTEHQRGWNAVVGPRGDLQARLRWPHGAALAGHVALWGGWCFAPDGSVVASMLPAVAVEFGNHGASGG